MSKPCMLVKRIQADAVKGQEGQEGESGGVEYALPIASVKTEIIIHESLAHIALKHTFFNPKVQKASDGKEQ